MEIQSTIALISINATMIVQLISFLLFLFVINRIMLQPLNQVKGSRADRLEEIRQEITTAEDEVEHIFAGLAKEEGKVKDEAFQRQHAMQEDAKEQAKKIFDAVQAQIETLKVETNQKVKEQIQEAKQHLTEESIKLARVIIEKTLERRLN
jgi:F-type H+-transporting ATPase subunit b